MKIFFTTGGTGFMGKILLEKLVRSLPKLKNIYLLMRPKKGKKIQERLDEFFTLEVIYFLTKYLKLFY